MNCGSCPPRNKDSRARTANPQRNKGPQRARTKSVADGPPLRSTPAAQHLRVLDCGASCRNPRCHPRSAGGPRPQQSRNHKGARYDPDASRTLPAAARRDVARSGSAAGACPLRQQGSQRRQALARARTNTAAANRDGSRSAIASSGSGAPHGSSMNLLFQTVPS